MLQTTLCPVRRSVIGTKCYKWFNNEYFRNQNLTSPYKARSGRLLVSPPLCPFKKALEKLEKALLGRRAERAAGSPAAACSALHQPLAWEAGPTHSCKKKKNRKKTRKSVWQTRPVLSLPRAVLAKPGKAKRKTVPVPLRSIPVLLGGKYLVTNIFGTFPLYPVLSPDQLITILRVLHMSTYS